MSAATERKTTLTLRGFSTPDEIRPIQHGTVEVVSLGDITAMRATFQPGWKWSESIKPVAGTESCQVAHLGYLVAGRMAVKMDDGTENILEPGEVGFIPPGHDAWVVGDEPVVFIDFQGGGIYAKPSN